MSRLNLTPPAATEYATRGGIVFAHGREPSDEHYPKETGAAAGLSRAIERANNGSMTAHVAAMRTRGVLPTAPATTASRPTPKPKAATPTGPVARVKALAAAVAGMPANVQSAKARQALAMLVDPDLAAVSPAGLVKALKMQADTPASRADADRIIANIRSEAQTGPTVTSSDAIRASWNRAHAAARGELHERQPDVHGWSAIHSEIRERRHGHVAGGGRTEKQAAASSRGRTDEDGRIAALIATNILV